MHEICRQLAAQSARGAWHGVSSLNPLAGAPYTWVTPTRCWLLPVLFKIFFFFCLVWNFGKRLKTICDKTCVHCKEPHRWGAIYDPSAKFTWKKSTLSLLSPIKSTKTLYNWKRYGTNEHVKTVHRRESMSLHAIWGFNTSPILKN